MNRVLPLLMLLIWTMGCSELKLKTPCQINEIKVTVGECITDSSFQLSLSFHYENPDNDFFEIFDRDGLQKLAGYLI